MNAKVLGARIAFVAIVAATWAVGASAVTASDDSPSVRIRAFVGPGLGSVSMFGDLVVDQRSAGVVRLDYSGPTLRVGFDAGWVKENWTLGLGTFLEPILDEPSLTLDGAGSIGGGDGGYAWLLHPFVEYRTVTPSWLVVGGGFGLGGWFISPTPFMRDQAEGAVQGCLCKSGILAFSAWAGAEQRFRPWVVDVLLSGSAFPALLTGESGNEWYVVSAIGAFGVEL
jgi:hypothetical protein